MKSFYETARARILAVLVVMTSSSAVAPGASAEAWQRFTGPNRDFSVELPARPTIETKGRGSLYVLRHGGALFMITYKDLAAGDVADPRALLTRELDAAARPLIHSRWSSLRCMTIDGHPAADAYGLNAELVNLRMLVALKGRRLYTLGYGKRGPPGTGAGPRSEATRFIQSFRLLR